MNISNKETATILAALRYWQQDLDANDEPPISDHFYDEEPLTSCEIDVLCEHINATESRALTLAEKFFYEHAGYSRAPNETEEQARTKCAIAYARAESSAREAGYSFDWDVSDEDSRSFSDDSPGWPLYDCVIRDANGDAVDSLGACDFGRDAEWPTGSYRRVVEAELALAVTAAP